MQPLAMIENDSRKRATNANFNATSDVGMPAGHDYSACPARGCRAVCRVEDEGGECKENGPLSDAVCDDDGDHQYRRNSSGNSVRGRSRMARMSMTAEVGDKAYRDSGISWEADHESPASNDAFAVLNGFRIFRGGARRRTSSFDCCNDTASATSEQMSCVTKSDSCRNVFSRLAKQKDVWSGLDDREVEAYRSVCTRARDKLRSTGYWLWSSFRHALQHPDILIYTTIVFGVLCVVTVALVIMLANTKEQQAIVAARAVAQDTGDWFSSELDKALLPLFTMSQFVRQLEAFHDLPFAIGARGAPYSAPPLPGPRNATHRDVSGVVTDEIQARFHDIAANIKEAADMSGVLVNIQLAPKGVVTLLHPVNNTEDFPDGHYMDNTPAVGHDILNDPRRVAIARATVPERGVVIAGPLTLIQGDYPVVREAFIARLAIHMPNHDPRYDITIDGRSYECWGFAVVLINWEELKSRSNIYRRFEELDMFFKLTRTDRKFDADSQLFYEEEIVIAHSEDADRYLQSHGTVEERLSTTNNEWVIRVGNKTCFKPTWKNWAIALAVLGSFFIAVMYMLILVAKREHEVLLFKMMPQHAIRRLEKGKTVVERYDMVTIFFSDIVGFTSMAGEMDPIEVMSMLNELYTEFDKLVKKHDVYKVETIGDAYMVLGGAPKRRLGAEGAERVALFALDAIEMVKTFRTTGGNQIFVRAGLASGPVVAGVVGTAMPRYCLFGDTVNLASRMESTSLKMKVQCSALTCRLLRDAPNATFICEERRQGDVVGVEVKGKGRQRTSWILAAQPRGIKNVSMNHAEDAVDNNTLHTVNVSSSENSMERENDKDAENGNGVDQEVPV